MPSHLKELVRARMEKTGESYQQALRQVRAEGERARGTRAPDPNVPEATRERSQSVADTAFSIAVVRAEEERRPAGERLFVDPYAAIFAAEGEHVRECTQRFLDLPFFHDGVRVRTRYIDDAVRDALTAGIEQVVLLGAGFDARGMRMPEIAERRAHVFEVDMPDQLARKRSILARAGRKVPPHVKYVPFDFDVADLGEELVGALEMAGFQVGCPAVFVWEGVIGYIDNDAIDKSLRAMVAAGGKGTRVAFTFGDGSFDPDTAATRTARLGFSRCEEQGGDDLWRRYHLPGDPPSVAFVMKLGLAVV